MNVLVVDDDKLVASSLKTILEADGEITVCEMGNSGETAVELYKKHSPDVLLMDIRMDGMTGLEAAEQILDSDPNAKILFLTTFSDDDYIAETLHIGAKGYILKQEYESIAPAIKAVFNGQSVFGSEIVGKMNSIIGSRHGFDYNKFDIGEREREIIRLVADGKSNKEIAEALFLSEGTVRNYLSGILEKLDCRDRTQLAVFYYKNIHA